MSKPMLVTLPFVLLLLDYLPLGRFEWTMLRATFGPLARCSGKDSPVLFGGGFEHRHVYGTGKIGGSARRCA